jgi:hypothetical protein
MSLLIVLAPPTPYTLTATLAILPNDYILLLLHFSYTPKTKEQIHLFFFFAF